MTDDTKTDLTIAEICEMFERSTDANIVRDCVRAIGAEVGGVFNQSGQPKDYERRAAVKRLAEAYSHHNPRIVTEYRGYKILSIEHGQPFLVNGTWIRSGYIISDATAYLNLGPGAVWFMTLWETQQGIDCLIDAGGSPTPPYNQGDPEFGPRFWALMEKTRSKR